MKSIGLTLFLIVLFACVLFSTAETTHQTAVQPQTYKQKAIDSEKSSGEREVSSEMGHTNNGHQIKPTLRSRELAFPRERTLDICGAVLSWLERRGKAPGRTRERRVVPIPHSLRVIDIPAHQIRAKGSKLNLEPASRFDDALATRWSPERRR
ncbi:hypothetical protein LXL04_035655 [Taraxacum kok-saghyz]